MARARGHLQGDVRGDPNVYVSGNLMVYYVEGHPEISVSPDVFVVKGVPSGQRRVYK
jgi:hypothetical protein